MIKKLEISFPQLQIRFGHPTRTLLDELASLCYKTAFEKMEISLEDIVSYLEVHHAIHGGDSIGCRIITYDNTTRKLILYKFVPAAQQPNVCYSIAIDEQELAVLVETIISPEEEEEIWDTARDQDNRNEFN